MHLCTEGGTAVPDGELRIAAQFSPRSGYAIDTDDAYILTQLGATEALTSASADGQIRPLLAESWSQVDPLTWRFVLRSGVTFHDGTPLTPAAVVTALGYVTGVAAPALRGLGLTVAEDGANAVRIATARPDPILPLRMSSPNAVILAPSAYSAGAPSAIGTGTGPMRLTGVEGTQRAVLERFDGYWGGRPALARVTATFVNDPAARALALRAGDVDIAQGLPESSLLEFSAGSGFDDQTVAAPRTVSLVLNQSAAPFADVRIRQAVTRRSTGRRSPSRPSPGRRHRRPSCSAPRLRGVLRGRRPRPTSRGRRPCWHRPGTVRTTRWRSGCGPTRTARSCPRSPLRCRRCCARSASTLTSRSASTARRSPRRSPAARHVPPLPQLPHRRPGCGCDAAERLHLRRVVQHQPLLLAAFDALIGTLDTTTDLAARQDVFRSAARMLVEDAVGVPLVHSMENGVSRNVVGYTLDPMTKQLVTPQLAVTG